MANFINKYLDLSAYDADSTKQYPNTSLVGTDVVFQMSAPTPAFGGLTVKYNISDPTQEVTLFNYGGSSSGSSESSSESGGGGAMPSKMYVDGNEETPINTWRFETAGEHIVQYEFENNIINSVFDNINDITEIVIGDDITQIPSLSVNGVFSNCLSLTTVTIGTGVTSIGNAAFQNCISLTSVTIGNSVTSIGEDAFNNCSDLISVTIPDSVTSIGDSAFNSCTSLTSFTVKATTPPTLGVSAFNNTNDCPIYVPSSAVEEYKNSTSTGWYEYASRIFAIQ